VKSFGFLLLDVVTGLLECKAKWPGERVSLCVVAIGYVAVLSQMIKK
jgi:hypothetical protein